ncbi:MAG: 4-phosphoerythronate dehydrogenase [Planctomycetes bacterium]|nr:4-phosphoerythronate dehydrogenase [Planctomycetota bacterium]
MKIVADQNIPFVEACFSSLGQVEVYPGRALTASQVADADVLLVRSVTKVDRSLLAGSRVKFVATATIGVEHVDTDWLASEGIGFASAPGSNANSVAEYVVAALLALGKKNKFNLAGKSIGVVGVGNVGSRVARKCAALGMMVKLNDPPLARQTGDPKYRPLDELFDCDFVTLHTPLTKEGQDKTFHLADASFFAALKRGVFFLNTSRGSVHDTAALKAALGGGKLSGVVLDVWENEPHIDLELLRKADITTPHIAGYSFDGKVAGLLMIYRAACEYFGLTPAYTEADFLPPPDVPEIVLTPDQLDEPIERLVHDTVQQVYAINRDDFNMREILLVPPDQRGAFFDRLRKEYPRRREFQNTTVAVPNVLQSEAASIESSEGRLEDSARRLAEILSGIGFQVRRFQ